MRLGALWAEIEHFETALRLMQVISHSIQVYPLSILYRPSEYISFEYTNLNNLQKVAEYAAQASYGSNCGSGVFLAFVYSLN